MHYQLVAPSHLFSLISARLTISAPNLEYSLDTATQQADPSSIIFQPSFFDHSPHPAHPVEVFLLPNPLAVTHGFMLAAAGTHADLATHAPVLDALSPMPSAWFHLGELGSASFIHQLWLILCGQDNDGLMPFWENVKIPEQGFQLNQPQLMDDLSSLIAQQQLQIQSIAGLAKAFLSQYPAHAFKPFHLHQTNIFGGNRDEPSLSPAHQIAQLLMSFQIAP